MKNALQKKQSLLSSEWDQVRAVGREETLNERVGGSAEAASRSARGGGGGGASSGSKSSA